MSSRWKKVWADFWGNKSRTFLIIITIAVGVLAVGFNTSLGLYMAESMDGDYLSASPHRAFAVSPKGAFAYRGGRRSEREAAEAALAACTEYTPDCTLYAVDDHLADTAHAGSR